MTTKKENKMKYDDDLLDGIVFPADKKDWTVSDYYAVAIGKMTGERDSLAKDLRRNAIFQDHRQQYKLIKSVLNSQSYSSIITISEPPAAPAVKTQHEINKILKDLKWIHLSGLNFANERFVKGHKLGLTIMDYPIIGPGSSATAFVVRDDAGYIERLAVYNLTDFQKEQIRSGKMLEIGTHFILIEPYVKIASDGKPAIRVDEPSTIVNMENKMKEMCRFCGKSDAKFRCGKCKISRYCCKECQTDDWTILNHKFVCD